VYQQEFLKLIIFRNIQGFGQIFKNIVVLTFLHFSAILSEHFLKPYYKKSIEFKKWVIKLLKNWIILLPT